MPGIFGFSKSHNSNFKIESMVEAMDLDSTLKHDKIFVDDNLSASRVHLGKIGEKTSPIVHDEIMIWIEGEAYNHFEISDSFGLEAGSLSQILIEAYRNNILKDFLNKLDGYFCAVLYDTKSQQLKLLTDRYGLRMLYWYNKDDVIAWGSEAKAILALEGIDKTIDETSLPCFMDNGHLLGDHTWFKHIKLVEPATIIHVDIKSKETIQEYYWTWSEIKKNKSIPFDDAVKKLGELFINSVERRFSKDEDIGMGLSGGLDSRAIFAALQHIYPDYNGFVYTFGIPGCEDIKIAQQVIENTECKYEKYYFTEKNWFEPRIDRVWKTDGMQDMKHMHGSEFSKKISNHLEIKLNGIYGDVIGGGYLKKGKVFDQRINIEVAKKYYGRQAALTNIDSEYYDFDSVDPYIFANRGRRFINMGLVNSLADYEVRMPFFDNKLLEFVYSLPDEFRFDNKIYGMMLCRTFPEYFKDIPWQKTGYPVSSNMPRLHKSFPYRVFRKIMRISGFSFDKKKKKNYTDYSSWVRSSDVSKKLTELLTKEGSMYSQYTDHNFADMYLFPHLEDDSTDLSDEILRATTFEIYLRLLDRKNHSCDLK